MTLYIDKKLDIYMQKHWLKACAHFTLSPPEAYFVVYSYIYIQFGHISGQRNGCPDLDPNYFDILMVQ